MTHLNVAFIARQDLDTDGGDDHETGCNEAGTNAAPERDKIKFSRSQGTS